MWLGGMNVFWSYSSVIDVKVNTKACGVFFLLFITTDKSRSTVVDVKVNTKVCGVFLLCRCYSLKLEDLKSSHCQSDRHTGWTPPWNCVFIVRIKRRLRGVLGGKKVRGVGVIKGNELKLKEIEVSLTLGGAWMSHLTSGRQLGWSWRVTPDVSL